MKISPKILLVTLCLAICLPAVIYSTIDNDGLMADERPQPQATKIDDLTYFVLIFAENAFYFDQFEFEAGDKFTLTSRKGDYTGTWSGVDVLNFTYFTAKVEVTETSTTTTTAKTTGTNLADYQSQEVEKMSDYLVNIWGFANTFPEPLQALGSMIGGGAYLGADVFFLGLTALPDVAEFGSITPSTGMQGQKYNKVKVTGTKTTFEEGSVSISFNPPEDIVTTGAVAKSNTEVEFDLEIKPNAATGLRSVTVRYGTGGSKSVTGNNVFEITLNTVTTTSTTTTP